jgi:hypothetical protein
MEFLSDVSRRDGILREVPFCLVMVAWIFANSVPGPALHARM